MSWSDYRERKEVVDTILEDVAERDCSHLPGVVLPRIHAVFGTVDDFLLALHYRWHNMFMARLDAIIEGPTVDVDAAIARTRDSLSTAHPALHVLLETYANTAALAEAGRWHQRQIDQARHVTSHRRGGRRPSYPGRNRLTPVEMPHLRATMTTADRSSPETRCYDDAR